MPSSLLRHAVKKAENHQHGKERQRRKHRLYPAPVGHIRYVGHIGVKGCVVGAGTEKSHDAVEQNDSGRRDGGAETLRGNVTEGGKRDSPEKIAQHDEWLALPEFI